MAASVVRTAVMYGVILLLVRVMGKRQISQLQTSELVVTLLISELAVLPIERSEEPIHRWLLPIGVLVACELLVSLGTFYSGRIRRLAAGRPVVVIREGKVAPEALRRLRMSPEELFEQLRLAGAFSLREVAWAVVETNGRLSVARRAPDDFLTPRQMGVKVKPRPLEVVVVSDGEVSESSLALCGKDRDWVLRELKKQGVVLSDTVLLTVEDGKAGEAVIRDRGKKEV